MLKINMKRTENPTADDILYFCFSAYLNVAFRNCRTGYWRKQQRIKTVSIDDEKMDNKTELAVSVCDETLIHNLDEISENPIIVNVISSLSDSEKRILSLHIVEKYSLSEISELTNMKYKRVLYTFAKIKENFKRSLIT